MEKPARAKADTDAPRNDPRGLFPGPDQIDTDHLTARSRCFHFTVGCLVVCAQITTLMEKDPRTYAIIGAAMAVHRRLGPGYYESVYHEALGIEFRRRAIPAASEVHLPVWYDGVRLKQSYRADYICHDSILVELKANVSFGHHEVAQLANYLCATRLPLGLLLNFGTTELQFQRVIGRYPEPRAHLLEDLAHIGTGAPVRG